MSEFHPIAKIDQIPEGAGRAFTVCRRLVAIFRKEGEFYAINDVCPHMGASLAEGYLEGDGVLCPWHAWKFCIKDGAWLDNPKSSIKTESYPLRIVGDELQVAFPDEPPPRD